MIGWLPFERRWRDAAVRAVLPASDDGRFPGLEGIDLASFWRRFDRAAPLPVQLGLRAAVWQLALLPLVTLRRPRSFASLSRAEQDRVLERCERSPLYALRQPLFVLKLAACFAGFGDAGVRARFETPPGEAAS